MTDAHRRLKLRARDSEDLRILSAVLQDALVPVHDIAYLPDDKRFVMVANRFRWEDVAPLVDLPDTAPREPRETPEGDVRFEDVPLYERVHAGVAFDRVRAAYYRGFAKHEQARVLELLALFPDPEGITLQFAGNAAVRLQGAHVVCHLEDLGEPWPTRWRPAHAPADASGAGGDASGATPGGATAPGTADGDGGGR